VTRTMSLMFLLLLSIGSTDAFAIDGSYSGNWFNTAQAGHGIVLEVNSPTTAIIDWYVYDNTGKQVWLYAEGTITGNRIDAQVAITDGMQFGVFDPTTLHQTLWGTLSLEFQSCNEATMTWNSTYTANGFSYGSGTLPLIRLSSIAGTQCGKRTASGVYTGFISSTPRARSYQVIASLDERGQAHMIQLDGSAVYDGTYTTNGSTTTLNLTGYSVKGFTFPNGGTTSPITVTGNFLDRDFITGPYTGASDTGTASLAYLATYNRGGTLAQIAGTYKQIFSGVTTTWTISSTGAIAGSDTASCQYAGNASVIDARFNSYALNFTISGCASSGTYDGVAVQTDALLYGDNKQILVGARTATVATLLGLIKQ